MSPTATVPSHAAGFPTQILRPAPSGGIEPSTTLPGPGTKLGLSFGESNLDLGPGDPPAATSSLVETNESFVIGVYHPVTQSLNLVVDGALYYAT